MEATQVGITPDSLIKPIKKLSRECYDSVREETFIMDVSNRQLVDKMNEIIDTINKIINMEDTLWKQLNHGNNQE